MKGLNCNVYKQADLVMVVDEIRWETPSYLCDDNEDKLSWAEHTRFARVAHIHILHALRSSAIGGNLHFKDL